MGISSHSHMGLGVGAPQGIAGPLLGQPSAPRQYSSASHLCTAHLHRDADPCLAAAGGPGDVQRTRRGTVDAARRPADPRCARVLCPPLVARIAGDAGLEPDQSCRDVRNARPTLASGPVDGGNLPVLAWVGQIIGHRLEGRKPAFLDDLRQLLIGPLFVLVELFPDLRDWLLASKSSSDDTSSPPSAMQRSAMQRSDAKA